MQEALIDLQKNYNTPGSPIAYSSVNTIYNYYKKVLPIKRINHFLQSTNVHSVKKEFKNYARNPTYARFKLYQMQIDLVFIEKLRKQNDGVNFLFVAIDTYTRYGYVRPLQNKKAVTVLNAFKSVIDQSGAPPYSAATDRGSEFISRIWLQYCEDENIKLIYTDASHASLCERFNRTMQRLIYSYLTANDTDRYIHKLPQLVETYNSRHHRGILMTPNEAEMPENRVLLAHNISKLLDKNNREKRRKAKLSVGDEVRIRRFRTTFLRGYDEQATREIFRIVQVKTNLPIPIYELSALDGEQITGSFYAFELSPVNQPLIESSVPHNVYPNWTFN
jgi:hypothetical protein